MDAVSKISSFFVFERVAALQALNRRLAIDFFLIFANENEEMDETIKKVHQSYKYLRMDRVDDERQN